MDTGTHHHHHVAGEPYRFTHGWKPIGAAPGSSAEKLANRALGKPSDTAAGDMIQSIHDSGGFTYDPRKGGLIKIGDVQGFAVAVPHTEEIVGNGAKTTREEFIRGVADVIQKHGPELANGAFLGGWYSPDRDVYMVELTELVPNRDDAIKLGKARNQEGIFDLGTGDYIDTGGTGG